MADGPRSEGQGNAGPCDTPPYLWALGAGCVVFALYALTLAPTTQFWDTSEYIATAHILGIPHPPGNPLFVVLAKAWTLLLAPFGLSVAVRVNLFSAFMSASAHAFWFLVIHQFIRSFSADRVFRLGGAAAAVLVSATAFTVWSQSNVNEKVYTVSLLTIALISWLAICWKERLGRGKEGHLLVLIAFVLALSVGNHLMAFLAAPALAVFVLLVKPGTVLNWRLYPPIMGAALLGLSIHLFLPIRAEFDPVINEAAPECAALSEALLSVATYGRVGCQPLNEAITRDQYTAEGEPGPGFSGPRRATLRSQITNYLQYFDWQWARAVDPKRVVFAPLRLPFTFLFLGLGVLGAIKHFRRERASFWYFLILFGTLSGALVYYLNFKYGYTLEAPVQDFNLHEVRERDYFFIASFSVWGLWAGMGIAALWRGSAMRFNTTLLRAVPVLGLALIPLVANWGWANRNYDFAARDWAHNLLMSVEPYGVLFTNGDNDTFPLWYLQEVEGIRRDVTVIVGTYLNSAWYAKQLRELTVPCPKGVQATDDPTRIICQRVYTAHNTDSIYVDDLAETGGKIPLLVHSPIRLPTRSILPFDDETVDRVARAWLRLDRGQSIPLGPIAVNLRKGQMVSPGMQYALAVISQALGDRPIYFSSNGGAASNLGLSPYLVRQGLAFRFHPGELADSAVPGLVRIADSQNRQLTGDWVDAPRTQTLLEEVFAHHSGIPDEWDHWPDRSELGIPRYYAFAYLSLAEVAARAGSPTTVEEYLERARAWMVLGS
jgi:hypothetical protein